MRLQTCGYGWLLALMLAVLSGGALPLTAVSAPPAATQAAKLTADDSLAGDEFGFAVALERSLAVIGAPGDDERGRDRGSAYLFERNRGGADRWGQLLKLNAQDAAAGARFGQAVAISGDHIAVGAPEAITRGTAGGAVYLFARDQGGAGRWGQRVRLMPADAITDDRFGAALALAGDTLVVGAPLAATAQAGAGLAYVFTRNQGGPDAWGLVTVLRSPEPTHPDQFGAVVALQGDTIAIGAPQGSQGGRVYLFARNQGGPDQWGLRTTLTGTATASFGTALALSDALLAVAAPAANTVTLFARNAGGADHWGRLTTLSIAGLAPTAQLGSALALAGDTLAVGARSADTFGANAGAVYLFERNQGGPDSWGPTVQLSANDTAAGDRFGEAVALHEATLLVGVRFDSDIGVDSGAAYSFFLDQGSLWHEQRALTATDAASHDRFGQALALNDDWLAVGAHQHQALGSDAGAVYLFARNQTGADRWGAAVKLTAADTRAGDAFGLALALSGNRLAVGAPYADTAGSDAGAVYLFERNQDGPDRWGQRIRLSAAPAQSGDFFGQALALSGDTLAVGAFAADAAGPSSGAVYIFERNRVGPDAWGQVARLTAADAQAGAQFGIALALDGDRLVVGAHFDDQVGRFAGAVYVFERNHGGPDHWGQVTRLTARDTEANDQFGFALALEGDRLLAGAPGHRSTGAAYVFERNQNGGDRWRQVTKLLPDEAGAGSRFGEAVALRDTWLAVGARAGTDRATGVSSGVVYLFARNQGGTEGWGQVLSLTPAAARTEARFGAALAFGSTTLAVGAPTDSVLRPVAGAVRVYRLAF